MSGLVGGGRLVRPVCDLSQSSRSLVWLHGHYCPRPALLISFGRILDRHYIQNKKKYFRGSVCPTKLCQRNPRARKIKIASPTGCPKKKCDLRLNAPRGLQK